MDKKLLLRKPSKIIEEKLSDDEFLRLVVALRNEQKENLSPYVKVIDDCWEHIFDFLSISDILKMSETCTNMQNMCGYYISEYFPWVTFELIGAKLFASRPRRLKIRNDFCKFVSELDMFESSFRRNQVNKKILAFIRSSRNFPSLKSIKLIHCHVTKEDIKNLRYVLSIIEKLELRSFFSLGNVFNQLSYYCGKLKSLQMEHCKSGISVFSLYFQVLNIFVTKRTA